MSTNQSLDKLVHKTEVSVVRLDHSYFLLSKIMIYFFMSSLLYLNRRDFIKVPRCVFSTC